MYFVKELDSNRNVLLVIKYDNIWFRREFMLKGKPLTYKSKKIIFVRKYVKN